MTFRQLLTIALLGAAAPASAQKGPAPGPVHVPPDIVSLACAPSMAYEAPPMPLRVTGSQEAIVHHTMAPGDLITINAGTDNGIDVGQQYFTRRLIPHEKRGIGRDNPAVVHTSAWIRIYAVDRQMSLATIEHACDAVQLDDYLEPFALRTPPPAPAAPPAAQRDNYGRVLVGQNNRTRFAKGDYFVVDRGSDHGVAPGAQFVVYRDKRLPENFLFQLGEAIAVDVRPENATLRVIQSLDAIAVGDYVALRK